MKWEIKTNYNRTLFEEIVNSGNLLIIEKMTKEQQEKGQRAIADKELNVFYQLLNPHSRTIPSTVVAEGIVAVFWR